MLKVKKRDGRVVPFNKEKIIVAILKSMRPPVEGTDKSVKPVVSASDMKVARAIVS